MAKLSKKPKPNSAGGDPGAARQSNPTLVIGIALAVAVAILMAVFVQQLQNTTEVLVATKDIPPYTQLVLGDNVRKEKVPAASFRKEFDVKDLNDYVDEQGKPQTVSSRTVILQGQRIAQGAVVTGLRVDLLVNRDEVLISIPTSLPAIVGGALTPGSVADVLGGSGGGNDEGGVAIAENVKIIGVGSGPQASANVSSANRNAKSSNNNQESGLLVVLAVSEADAHAIISAGQVTFALKPRLTYNQYGEVCDHEDVTCLKSPGPKEDTAADPLGEEPAPESSSGAGEEDSELPASPVQPNSTPEDPKAGR